MKSRLTAKWVDSGREPSCPPNPRYPHGMDLDTSGGSGLSCAIDLPYPALRCGSYVIDCALCGTRALVTTAGRPDDPRSLRVACRPTRRP